jgi:hypothetical protein
MFRFRKKWGLFRVAGQILTNQGGLLHAPSYFLKFIFFLLIIFFFFLFMVQELKPFATFYILYLFGLVSLDICSLFSVPWKRLPCPAMCLLFLIDKLILVNDQLDAL